MTKKMKIVLTAVAALPFALAVILFGPPRGEPVATMPISPGKVTDVGRYYLDDTRFVEIRKGTDGLEYWEGRQQPGDAGSTSPQVVSYSASEIQSVRLDIGWAIEFNRPDQLLITLGAGKVVDRTFGEAQSIVDFEPSNTSTTRRRRTE